MLWPCPSGFLLRYHCIAFFKNSKRIFNIFLLIFCRAALPPRFRAPYCPQGTEKAALRGKKRPAHGRTAHPSSNAHYTRYPYSQLGNGCLTAHGVGCLVLLGSPPDTVHRALLRKTKSSTPLIQVRRYDTHPRSGIPPRWSGLRVTRHRYLPE